MDPSPLESYIESVHKSQALDLVRDIEKALATNDGSAALIALGELRSLIWLMHFQILTLQSREVPATE